MSDTTPTPGEAPTPPPATPGERRLAHPPSDRYRAAETRAAEAAAAPDPGASLARGVALAAAIALVGAAAIVYLGGVVAVSAGLVPAAGGLGWAIGAALRWGVAEHLSRPRRVGVAVGLAIAAVALAQLGLWQFARSEGGVLQPLDYLLEVFGPLVPLELGAGALLAWFATR